MVQHVLLVVFFTTVLASRTYGQLDSVSDDNLEMLDPILFGVDEHGHMLPVLGHSSEKPLLGRPDGHELNGRDGTSQPVGTGTTEKPLIGQPDGHDAWKDDLVGRPDGHDGTKEDLIGKPDGHDSWKEDILGRPDGHDSWKEELTGQQDDREALSDEVGGTYDGEEPLVRCKRPLCMMECDFGFQTDSTGCPVCRCLEDPCQGVQCSNGELCKPVSCKETRACTEMSYECRSIVSCPMPMCATFCPDGYANDARGCMTCTCIGETPQSPSNIHKNPDCPEPMCANYCPNGYEKNSRGCMTCDCIEETPESIKCGAEKCSVGQVCRSASGSVEEGTSYASAHCAPQPLCRIAQDMAYMKRERLLERNLTRMFVPECDDDDGNFKPRQCNYKISECWCVDDRGKVLDGTKTSISDEGISLQCSPRITTAVLMEMILTSSEDNDEDDDHDEDDDDSDDNNDDISVQMEELHDTLEHVISSWLLMEEQYVAVVKVEQISDTEKGGIIVRMKIGKSESVDLPSAIEHMKRKLRMGDGNIPLDDDVFIPDLDSLNIVHQYDADEYVTPTSADNSHSFIGEAQHWYQNCLKSYPFWLASLVFIVLLLILAFFSVLMVHHRRKYSRSLQFRHHILENQYSHEQKSFVEGEVAVDFANESSVVLVHADDLEKKQPIA